MILLDCTSNFDSIIQDHKSLVLVDFYADWCDPCKWLDQILISIEPQVSSSTVVLKVDVEKYQELRERFNIKGIPVLMLFKKGEVVWRMNGFLAENELLEKIRTFE